jgi:glycosyltransferase involved in cell wall biosynthesis
VDESFARGRAAVGARAAAVRAAGAPGLLLREAADRPLAASAPLGLERLLFYAGRAGFAREWMRSFLRRPGVDPARTLAYTYWLSDTTLGFGLARPDGLARLVSRVHGIDVYEERHPGTYLPLRRATFGVLDRLFTASEHARRYVEERYPFAPPCETRQLAVPDPGFTAKGSTDGVLRVFSCAYVSPVKRLDLLARGIERLARDRPDRRVEWTHVGGGSGRPELAALAERILPPNASARFTGSLPNEAVLALYRTGPVDVLVNVSASEGGVPVTLMEACSCGIPVVATAVGGNPEIAGPENGALLSADPSPEEVARALGRFLDEPELRGRRGAASRAAWSARFDAGRNYAAFARRLAGMLQGAGEPPPSPSPSTWTSSARRPLRSLELLVGIYLSARDGRTVSLPLDS